MFSRSTPDLEVGRPKRLKNRPSLVDITGVNQLAASWAVSAATLTLLSLSAWHNRRSGYQSNGDKSLGSHSNLMYSLSIEAVNLNSKSGLQAVQYSSDPIVCLEAIAKAKWPNGLECPKCQGKRLSFLKTGLLWICLDCRKQTRTVKADGTLIGGKARFMNAGRREKMIRGRGPIGKAIVFGLKDGETGKFCTSVVANAQEASPSSRDSRERWAGRGTQHVRAELLQWLERIHS